jgi:hypothetical protein
MEGEESFENGDELEDLRLEIADLEPTDQVDLCLDRLKEAYDRIGSNFVNFHRYRRFLGRKYHPV